MDKDNYIIQCITLLEDTNTYRRRIEYPTKDISNLLTSTLIRFKHTLYNYNTTSYQTTNTTIPKFYGIPKTHKAFQHLPPFRPIISHCNSPHPCCVTTRSHTITLSTIIPRLPTQLHNTSLHITSNTTTRQCHTSYY